MDSRASTPLPETELDELIFANQIIKAIGLLRERNGLSIPNALKAFTNRYNELRVSEPSRFVCDHDKYWEGFYS